MLAGLLAVLAMPVAAAEIAVMLESQRLRAGTERGLQASIETVLREAGVAFIREHRLSAQDRVDFLVGGIALEVKTKGSLAEVTRQLHRYAQYDEVTSLLLVTSRMQLAGVPKALNGKPVRVSVQWSFL